MPRFPFGKEPPKQTTTELSTFEPKCLHTTEAAIMVVTILMLVLVSLAIETIR